MLPQLSFLGLTQIVVIPALIPPWISELRLSPTITVFSGENPGILAKQASKNSLEGLLNPSSWEMNTCSKYRYNPALVRRLCCTLAVPLLATNSRYFP